ncbi:histone-lysine n-methyltransferase atxr3 [Hordeum vulgare]|nr:histone-lysine n-methyltransferase atxr3 [Hordeum vulgare]
MTEEEAELIRRVMEDSMNTHDEHQWVVLETTLALYAADDVAIPELEQTVVVKEEVMDEPPLATWNPQLVGQQWGWSNTTAEMANVLGVGPWSAMPPRSPEQEQEPREEAVVQAPPAHLWQPPPYVDLTSKDDK